MSTTNDIELVRQAYQAFSAGDAATLSTLFADDVVHTFPGTSQISGAHEGLSAVLTLYGRLAELTGGTLRIELEDLLTDGTGRVLAIHTANATRNGQNLEAREGLVVTVHDGKIVSLDDFFDDLARYDDFWA